MVLMEAMAIGLPVVSTFHSGIPELVEDGKQGFWFLSVMQVPFSTDFASLLIILTYGHNWGERHVLMSRLITILTNSMTNSFLSTRKSWGLRFSVGTTRENNSEIESANSQRLGD